jgi:hypothetical protein
MPRRTRAHYFIRLFDATEVSREQFRHAEELCGFQSKFDGQLATGGFSHSNVMEGSIRHY